MLTLVAYFLLAGATTALSDRTVYDQRQTGKTNIHIELKDSVIIALDNGESGGDYDYNYDYSDLTIKPGQQVSSTSSLPSTSSSTTQITQTTPSTKPVSTTANYNLTQNSGIVLEVENDTIIFPASIPGNASKDPVKIISNSYKPDQIPVLVIQEPQENRPNRFLPVKTVEKEHVSPPSKRAKSSNQTASISENLPDIQCSPGYYLDSHNRCKRTRRKATTDNGTSTQQRTENPKIKNFSD